MIIGTLAALAAVVVVPEVRNFIGLSGQVSSPSPNIPHLHKTYVGSVGSMSNAGLTKVSQAHDGVITADLFFATSSGFLEDQYHPLKENSLSLSSC